MRVFRDKLSNCDILKEHPHRAVNYGAYESICFTGIYFFLWKNTHVLLIVFKCSMLKFVIIILFKYEEKPMRTTVTKLQ
jgi:hypothetical protein